MLAVTSERLAVGLLFVVIAALACFAPSQSDTWFFLRGGRETLQSGAISLHDTYSYTAAGQFWPHHEWLSEVVFYALYRIAGLPLLTGFCAAVIVGAWTLSWRLTEGAFEVRFLLFAACLATCAISWAIRPQVFSLAAFVLTSTLLVNNRLRWLPFLFVVWTNLHGAVALGLAAIFAALCADVLTHRRLRWPYALTTVACVAATFVSPLGARLWSFVPESMERSRVDQIIEWQAPGASAEMWPFWTVAAALPIAMVYWRRRLDERTLKLAAIALAILPLAVRSQRNVPVFLLLAVPALTALARERAKPERVPRAAGERVRVNAAILGAAGSIAALLVALAWIAPAPSLGWRPIAPAAIQAIGTCGQPMYNTYNDGGVLIWFVPQQKVFLDSRQDPYPLDLLRDARRVEFDGNYQALFTRFGIRCAVVPASSPLARPLQTAPGWSRRYADKRWAVFTKGTEP